MDLLATETSIKEHRVISSLGGKATFRLYGKKHFSDAGKKGMKSRWGDRKPKASKNGSQDIQDGSRIP